MTPCYKPKHYNALYVVEESMAPGKYIMLLSESPDICTPGKTKGKLLNYYIPLLDAKMKHETM